MDIPGIYSPGIFHSWNLFLSWNFLFLESYFTEFTCYLEDLIVAAIARKGVVYPWIMPTNQSTLMQFLPDAISVVW